MFLCFSKSEPRKDISYFRKMNIQSSKIESKNAVKTFSYFRKLKFSTPSLKNSVFSGEPLRVFHHCFFSAFIHFITVFSGCFVSPLVLLLFFECFHFSIFLYRDCFLSGTSFLRCCTRVLRI